MRDSTGRVLSSLRSLDLVKFDMDLFNQTSKIAPSYQNIPEPFEFGFRQVDVEERMANGISVWTIVGPLGASQKHRHGVES